MEETVVVVNYGDRVDIPFAPATDEATPSLSGDSLVALLAKNYGDVATITKTVGAGITWTDQPGGDFNVEILPADTVTLGPGEHRLSVKITAPPEAIRTVGRVRLVIEDTVREE
jgi:hypothetical protein